MKFEELDETTRGCMLAEFGAEEASGEPYRNERLSANGLAAFPELVRQAILQGDETTLVASLMDRMLWRDLERHSVLGVPSFRRYSIPDAAEGLGLTEFNTWYVRGLAKRLLGDGQTDCQVYRADDARTDRGDCGAYEGKVVSLDEVYRGHRVRYWPKPGNSRAFSIPSHTLCYHTIRRLSGQ